MKKIVSLLIPLLVAGSAAGQSTPFVSLPHQLQEDSFAEWIVPGDEPDEGVFYFRKETALADVPEQFLVHVSADNRYRLYVNGKLASWGPAAGDLYHWNYETVDLAPYLEEGENVVAALVWNPGRKRGSRQISHRTAFILQGHPGAEQVFNTDRTWKVKRNEGHFFMEMDRQTVGGGYIAGATDSLVGAKNTWEWNRLSLDDRSWENAVEIGKGNHSGLDTWLGTPWLLKPRTIPVMEQQIQQIPRILYVEGLEYNGRKENGKLSLEIPAGTRVEVLLDNRVLTMGFPQLSYSGGAGGKIRIRYQEALFNEAGEKGNRNEWQGKSMKGYYDVVLPDGNERLFEPLWIRVFRYVRLTIETADEPLSIHDFHNRFTAYPFEQKAAFVSDDPSLDPIWNASWRTARLCALETYMDCPYYEQIQYIGDTRIQALISLYVAGDDRLVRNALEQFYNSMQPMGLTQSRFPADGQQIIPPFSLYFIAMVHDFHMHRDDPVFVKQFLPGIRFIMDWFVGKIDHTGMLGPLPFWNHIDGGTRFRAGSPPGIEEGGSAHMTILLAYAMERAVELFSHFGDECNADRYRKISVSLMEHALELCYNRERGLIAETPSQKIYSQHTNIFAILTGLFEGARARSVAHTLLEDESLIQATLYFRFYLFQALYQAGMGGEILSQMELWTGFLEQGLTTFPEHGLDSRSDCHAWAAHPMYDLLSMVCGINPAKPGFSVVRIQPQPGDLQKIRGSVAHPEGMIEVDYTIGGSGEMEAEINLPGSLTGTFIWNGKSHDLVPGNQHILAR